MKRCFIVVFAAVVILGLTGNGHACPAYSLTSSTKKVDTWMSFTSGGTDEIDFILALDGFDLSADMDIVSATLFLNFEDDTDLFDLYEFAGIFDGYTNTLCEIKTGNVVINVSSDGLISLNSKGELTFTLTRMYGDFTCKSAMLAAVCDTVPVPIPNTLWLFGPTLIGFIGVHRKITGMTNQD